MPNNPLVGAGYNEFIGTRQKAGQTQTEFYNKQTNQAFANPNDLLRAVQPYAGNQVIDESNVFQILAKGYTPRDTAMNQIKNDLNSFQDQMFNSGAVAGKRAASSINDSIASEQGNYDTYFKEYNDLKTKLQALSSPNYQQNYNDLRQSSGIPGIENDFANNQKTIRELPYVNRMNFGNAAGATEGQLNADTQQKGIPLEIQQGNLLDRLKLAQSFIDNSLKFKELDTNQARQSLSDGLNAALETINLSRTHLSDLQTRQQAIQADQQKAQQFAFDNRVTQPFYEIGGTVFRTSDQRAAHDPKEYIAMGGKGDFSDVQKLSKLVTPIEVNPGNNLVDPTTGKVIYSAPYTPSQSNVRGGTSVAGGGNAVIGGGNGSVIIPQNTLAGKNNNPGNLRFVGQAGASQGQGGFASFPTPEAGYQALISQIQLDAGRGLSLSQFVNKYAPPSENNTSQYLSQAINALGGSASTKLSSFDVNSVAAFMAKKESGTIIGSAPKTKSVTSATPRGNPIRNEEKRVKEIISLNPGEWGDAANQIDKELGAGTATKYDNLLKSKYAPKSKAKNSKDEIDPAIKAWLGM